MKTYRYWITPTNEGESTNYTEIFKVAADNRDDAQTAVNIRENTIIAGLMKLLPSGTWDCDVEPFPANPTK